MTYLAKGLEKSIIITSVCFPVVPDMKRKRVQSDTILKRSTSFSFPSNTISKEEFEHTLGVFIVLTLEPDSSGLNNKKKECMQRLKRIKNFQKIAIFRVRSIICKQMLENLKKIHGNNIYEQ